MFTWVQNPAYRFATFFLGYPLTVAFFLFIKGENEEEIFKVFSSLTGRRTCPDHLFERRRGQAPL